MIAKNFRQMRATSLTLRRENPVAGLADEYEFAIRQVSEWSGLLNVHCSDKVTVRLWPIPASRATRFIVRSRPHCGRSLQRIDRLF